MNPFYVLFVCLAATTHTDALRPKDLKPTAGAKAHTLPLAVFSKPPEDSSPAKLSSSFAIPALSSTEPDASELLETKESTSLWAASWARCSALFRLASREPRGPFMVILVAVLLGCLLFMLCTVAGSSFKSIASPAGDLLDKPIDPFLQDKVPTPPRGFQPKQQPKQPAREPELPATQPVLPAGTSGSGLFSGSASIMSNIFGGGPITHLPEYREHLMPEMLVQEPEGMQVFIDGELTNRERNGYCEVWRSAGARDAKKVMKLTFCEGTSGPHGHQNGISLEIMDISKMPVAYLNTQFAIDRPGHMSKHALSPKRHITIFDTFTESVDFHQPFATAEREARGVTLRRVSNGEVICVVASGGYNTDFGNITDASGRLIATSSNRGANLFGIGMVHGSWTQDRRSLTISQGTDVAMIVCAIVCTAKLS